MERRVNDGNELRELEWNVFMVLMLCLPDRVSEPSSVNELLQMYNNANKSQ